MAFHKQKTLANEIKFQGIGLHSGNLVNLKIKPAKPNTGIIFVRTDLKTNNVVIPHVNNVCSAVFCTTVSNEHGVKISTLEHLISFIWIGN